jgi:hypothetical protein
MNTQAVTSASEVLLDLPALSNVAAPRPDANGEFATPADGAKFMASLGIPQVPLSAPADTRFSHPGKNPAINGKNWQDKATTNPAQIDRWAKKYLGCNFGSIAKSQVDGFYVLETDSPDLAQKYAQETKRKFQSELVIDSSAPGRNHRWYQQSSISLVENHNIGQEDARGFSLRCDNQQAVSPGSIHASGKQYRVAYFSGSTPAAQPVEELRWINAQKPHSVSRAKGPKTRTLIPPGGHHDALLKELGSLIYRGYSKEAAEQALLLWAREWLESPGHKESLEDHIKTMVGSTDDWERGAPDVTEEPKSPPAEQSVQMADGALYGVLGRIIRKLQPETESHPMGNLLELMTSVGSAIGRTAHVQMESTPHFCNLFFVRVGVTGRSRKGTGKDRVAAIMGLVDPTWLQYQNTSGLGSGEAVIWAIRDQCIGPVQNKRTRQWNTEVIDPGVENKTLHISEGEFVGVLTVTSRKDNILSKIIRDGWDGKPLRNTVKTAPCSCLEPHLSMACDITREELLRVLSESEKFNGFANRFLWCHVYRTQELPHGGEPIDWTIERQELQNAIKFAQGRQRVYMDRNAKLRWERMYHDLGIDEPGFVGAVTARAEPQVLRMALIFAMLDLSNCITVDHLEAANSVWQYCLASAKFIFGQTAAMSDSLTGGQLKLLNFLRGDPKTRTQIYVKCCHRNTKAGAITLDLNALKKSGLITEGQDAKGTSTFVAKGDA